MSTFHVEIQLTLGVSQTFDVVHCALQEGISQLTSARIQLAAKEYIDFGNVIASDAHIEVLVSGSVDRHWTLKVASAGFLHSREGSLRHFVELRPALWFLSHTKNVRKFRNMSSQDIISKVLDEGRITHRWNTTRTTPVRKYCVQYRESNLAFVQRLLEFEGIYYIFDSDGVLLLSDRSTTSPTVPGQSHFELLSHAGAMEAAELGIHQFNRGRRIASGTATVNDFSWKTPRLKLLSSCSAEENTDLEIYDYPSGYRKPAQGQFLAQVRLEALRVPARYVSGWGNVTSFAPAYGFHFDRDAGDAFAGQYLLTEVQHQVMNAAYSGVAESDGITYRNSFRAIPKSVPYRPAMATPHPKIAGCHTVRVRGPEGSEIHTDRYGRFRAQFHWDRQATSSDEDSRWLRKLQESATSMNIARVGWEVSVGYIAGDPDRPIGLTRSINGIMIPSYGQPAKRNVMTIKTPTSPVSGGFNELRLDDSAGSQLFYIKAEKDQVINVEHNKTEKVGNNETVHISKNYVRSVANDQNVTIGANNMVTIGGNLGRIVLGNRTKIVGGNETLEVANNIQTTTNKNETENVGSIRLTVSGSVSMPDLKGKAKAAATSTIGGLVRGGSVSKIGLPSLSFSLSDFIDGSIRRQTSKLTSRMVGGVILSAAGGNIRTFSDKLYTETVGGAKLTVTPRDIGQVVSGPTNVTVGAAIIRNANGDMGYSSNNTAVTVGVNVSIVSEKKIEIRSNHIVLQAEDKFSLKTGELEFCLEPERLTVTGTMRLEAGNRVIVTGNDDNFTKF